MIDTHTHIYFEDYYSDIDKTIKNALDSNVLKMIVVGIDYNTSVKCIDLASKYENILYPTVGYHPSDLADFDINLLEKLLLDNISKVVAIGEIGFDFYHFDYPFEIQKEAFISQIELSIKYDLPLIIHSRDSFDDLIKILKIYKGKIKGVVHCFNLGYAEAMQIIDCGLCLGIGGILTYNNASLTREAISLIDINYILLETDSPFLTPSVHRSLKNEPAYVKYVLEKISQIRNIDINELEKILNKNTYRVFSKIKGE